MVNYLGLDPSSLSSGWAVVNNKEELVDYGVIKGRTDDPKSFVKLFDEIESIIKEHDIKGMYIEDTFFSMNIATLKKIVRPSGIFLYMIGKYDLEHNFTMPKSWRKTAFGDGNTTKKDTYKLINERFDLGFTSFNKYNDITDAIGIAIACAKDLSSD